MKADIFNKAVCPNIPKPLRSFCTKFDVNALRYCGEMACVEEYLHLETLTSLYLEIAQCTCVRAPHLLLAPATV